MQHPGEILQEKLNISGMSKKELAIRTNVTEKHVWTIINGEKGISTAFAKKLGYVFENAGYWMNLQAKFDTEQDKIQKENDIEPEEIDILKPLHDIMMYFIEKGYMHNNCGDATKIIQMREFLQISDLTLIPQIHYYAAYRAQIASNIKVDPYVLFAWQRLCEKETENIKVNNTINKELLSEKINDIKSLMFGNINDGIKELQTILADCGIAFQVVKNFRGAPVQGFIKETVDGRLILCLTIRGKRADRFWFTLFHEIAHILHGDYKARFVDFDSVSGKSEEMADQYASNTLIPPDQYRKFILSNDCTSWDRIEAFAEAVGVEPFIVLGRLQNDEYLEWSDYPNKVVKYNWA